MEITFTQQDILGAAQQLWQHGKAYKVWAFHGEMGSGKTTFISALCEVLGVNSATSSPTYAIINEYTSAQNGNIFHMDWYRLKDEEEAIQAGVEDALYSNQLCLVEWPEKAPTLLPDHTLHIYITTINASTRVLSVPAL